MKAITDEGVEVVVPPLHHQVVTAAAVKLAGTSARRGGCSRRRSARSRGTSRPGRARGDRRLGPAVLPPRLSRPAEQHLPFDRRASTSADRPVSALLDAQRFPSDPDTTSSRRTTSRSCSAATSGSTSPTRPALFEDTDASSDDEHPQRLSGRRLRGRARAAEADGHRGRHPGADLIPRAPALSRLHLDAEGRAGPPRIANFETLGLVDLRDGYFRGGTHMHLSHLFEDVEAWYLNFDFRERVDTTFRPGSRRGRARRPFRRGPRRLLRGRREARLQPHRRDRAQRLDPDDVPAAEGLTAPTGLYKGTAIPQRADFNTLDNPFFWTADPERDRHSEQPDAGLHFVIVQPVERRLPPQPAGDGRRPAGRHRLPFEARSRAQGLNSVLRTTHRQNFLVPPRSRRSFPLVELIR